jgi:hypothetical protein
MREGDVGFVENQRQIRAGQNDSVHGITSDKGFGEAGKAVAFRVSSDTRRRELKEPCSCRSGSSGALQETVPYGIR